LQNVDDVVGLVEVVTKVLGTTSAAFHGLYSASDANILPRPAENVSHH
jgi:hypothetical protein